MIKAFKLEICVDWVLKKIIWHGKCCQFVVILDFFLGFKNTNENLTERSFKC